MIDNRQWDVLGSTGHDGDNDCGMKSSIALAYGSGHRKGQYLRKWARALLHWAFGSLRIPGSQWGLTDG